MHVLSGGLCGPVWPPRLALPWAATAPRRPEGVCWAFRGAGVSGALRAAPVLTVSGVSPQRKCGKGARGAPGVWPVDELRPRSQGTTPDAWAASKLQKAEAEVSPGAAGSAEGWGGVGQELQASR